VTAHSYLWVLNTPQAQAAAGEPEVRAALRRGFAGLLGMVERGSGATPHEVQRFFARGMLCNVIAAMQIDGLDEHWAWVLTSADAVGAKTGSVEDGTGAGR
jgi:hypothetical protein